MIDDPIITVSDLIPPYCPWGVRRWMRENGVDFADFLKNGVKASVLTATNDLKALEIVARKRGEACGRG